MKYIKGYHKELGSNLFSAFLIDRARYISDLNIGKIILMLRIYSTGTDLHRQVAAAP